MIKYIRNKKINNKKLIIKKTFVIQMKIVLICSLCNLSNSK